MSDALEKTNHAFDTLGVSSEADVSTLFDALLRRAVEEIASAKTAEELESFRVRWLGRNNSIKSRVQENWLKPAAARAKKWVGASFNACFRKIEEDLVARKSQPSAAGSADRIDLSLPGVVRPIGTRHLIRQTYDEVERIFLSLGYTVVEGPEIETPYYNFEALNIPEHHPARDNMDTFYLE
ncbi:MAG: hypothetical protein WAL78_09365, partial [Candidatus Acidiferrales bacterium]